MQLWEISFADIVSGIKKILNAEQPQANTEEANTENKEQAKEQANTEQVNKEQSRLEELFPGLDSNAEIMAIKAMIADGNICQKRTPPRFFDGLFYLLEQDWSQCQNVIAIHLELIPDLNYEENIFQVAGVLCELILNSDLEYLTLKWFPPELLLNSLATLREMTMLDYLDVSNNSLTTNQFAFLLRSLPEDPIDKIEANFSKNCIMDEKSVARLIGAKTIFKSVQISSQLEGELDLAAIRTLANQSVPYILL